jgi:hypothetical protein
MPGPMFPIMQIGKDGKRGTILTPPQDTTGAAVRLEMALTVSVRLFYAYGAFNKPPHQVPNKPYARSGASAQTSTSHGRRTLRSAVRVGTGSRRALLRFLGDYAGPVAFWDQHPGVVDAELRVIDTPADLMVRLEDVDRAPDWKAERLPVETRALREPGKAAVDPHVGRVGVPARPPKAPFDCRGQWLGRWMIRK